jgi:hypothetical protein
VTRAIIENRNEIAAVRENNAKMVALNRHALAMDDQVTLRPAREDDLPILEKLTQDPEAAGEFSWFGWFDPQRWRRERAESRLLSETGGY